MNEKLVRDLIPQVIASNGEKVPPWRIAKLTEYPEFLAQKLDEEFTELKTALALLKKANAEGRTIDAANHLREATEEAADLMEVLLTAFDPDKVEDARFTKHEERGGFKRGVVMEFE